jgi:hypothetical protein
MVATLLANVVVHSGNEHWQSVPWTVTTSTSVVIAIVIVSGVNRALVTGGLVILGVRGTGLLGSRDDNLFELATLCLGGLAALAILHEPWLAILVLVPMIALQRGARVGAAGAA